LTRFSFLSIQFISKIMRKNFIRQLVALALLGLFTPALQAQFQRLYRYGVAAPAAGIFKDVQCMEVPGPGGEAIIAVGSDNQVPVHGLIAYHDVAGLPINYIVLTNTAGNMEDAVAICKTPAMNRVVACFYDPVAKASDIVNTNANGFVNWMVRVPNFQVRDVVAGPNVGGVPAERIWLTGNMTNGALPTTAVVGLNGAGGAMFFTEYVLPAGYTNHLGYEIDYSGAASPLTVVGKTSINACYDGILAMRLQANGAVTWAKVYSSPLCNYDLKGKALVLKPGAGNNYIIGFEYKNPAVAGATYPGLLQINNLGGLAGINNYYTSAGFFNGTNYVLEGLDTDGATYMLSGMLTNGTSLQTSGFSLNAGAGLAGVQFNEYETGGAFAPTETKLVDLDYYTAQGRYVMGGHFKPAAGGAWPLNVAFWLVATNAVGAAVCSNPGAPVTNAIVPNTATPGLQTIARDGIIPAPLIAVNFAATYVNQCTPKRDGGDVMEEVLGQPSPTFAYREGQGDIIARIPAEVKNAVSVTLIDLQGRVLSRLSLTAGEHRIDVSQWATGVYFVQYQGEGIAAGVQKIAVR
jgi:hypothetical protein